LRLYPALTGRLTELLVQPAAFSVIADRNYRPATWLAGLRSNPDQGGCEFAAPLGDEPPVQTRPGALGILKLLGTGRSLPGYSAPGR
jgi:hypothetical protein